MIALAPSRLLAWLTGSVPSWVYRSIVGPVTRVHITLGGAELIGSRRRGRPVHVVLGSEVVLTVWLVLPETARRDIREAASLKIESETPFHANEVSARITQESAPGPEAEWRYRIDMVPLDIISHGLRQLGLELGSVRSISTPGLGSRPSIHLPIRSLRSQAIGALSVLIPLVAIATCGVAAILGEAARQQAFALILETSALAEMSALKADQARLDERTASAAGRAAYEGLLSKTPSAFLLLNELKRGIPADVEIGKLEIADGLVTLSVITTDALAVIRLMNERPGWQAAAGGSIASDPSTAKDVATINVRIAL